MKMSEIYDELIKRRDQLSKELDKCNEEIEKYEDSELLERIKNIDLENITYETFIRKRPWKVDQWNDWRFVKLINMVLDFSSREGFWIRFAKECLENNPDADDEELVVWYIEEVIEEARYIYEECKRKREEYNEANKQTE